jgi:CRP-like cAMP-binding protein
MLEANLELLSQVPLFQGLSAAQLAAIAGVSRKTFFEAGETLIAEGETGDTAYLIMTGKAGCEQTEHRLPLEEDLWPGTLVGELAMLVETVHNLTVTARERLRALSIEREAFRTVMEADPAIAEHISEKLLVRLHGLATDLRKVDSTLARIDEAA